MNARQDLVQIGYVSGLHGLKGWVKVFSYTDPPANIFGYSPWLLQQSGNSQELAVVESLRKGSGLIARLENIDGRDQAAELVGSTLWVAREKLPEPNEGEYYWADLVGMEVYTDTGENLGVVHRLFATGANDVMVVRGDRERLVPWIRTQVVVGVNLERQRITVRWDPEF